MQSMKPEINRCIQSVSTEMLADESVGVTAQCSFPSSFIGFAGHFIDNPVLPAVVQLATVRQIAERATEQRLFPAEFSKTKFRAMVRPGQQLIIQIALRRDGHSWKGKFNVKTDTSEQIAAGNFRFCTSLDQ